MLMGSLRGYVVVVVVVVRAGAGTGTRRGGINLIGSGRKALDQWSRSRRLSLWCSCRILGGCGGVFHQGSGGY